MLFHHVMQHMIALLALSLCSHSAATPLYSTTNHENRTADHLPLVDLGYAVYKPTNYNVSLCEFLNRINVDLK